MRRSRKKLDLSRGVKYEGAQARNKVLQCSSSSGETHNFQKSSLSSRKIQVIESVSINKGSQKEVNSIFVSPSTKKEFLVLNETSTQKNKYNDPDRISLDDISVSNLISPLESPYKSALLKDVLSTPKSKQFNTPTSSSIINTDGNICIYQTSTSTNYRGNTLHSQSDDDFETSFTRHKIPAPGESDSDDENIFEIRPNKFIKSNVTQTIPHINENLPSVITTQQTQQQAHFEVNVSVKERAPEDSSIASSESDFENTSDTDTFDEIYDSNSESDISSLLQDDNEKPENQWIDITDQISFAQSELATKITLPPNILLEEPLDYYKLFVTEEVIAKMVMETNKHAADFLSSHVIKPKSRLRHWEPTTFEEMQRFMGVLLVMGINKIPKLDLYWSKKSCYRNEYISRVMPRDRFLLLLKFWHFSENIDNGDKLYKIRNVLDILLKSFSDMLKPGRFIVIDETMIPWKGRLQFRQYIKNKAHKYGIKLYKLCTPEGYTYSLMVYTGKDEEKSGEGHGYDVVFRLTKDLLDEGRTLIADNFYTSVSLAEALLKKKTYLCGTVRTNRKRLPKTVISTKLKKGQVIGKMNNGVKIIKWMDKRPVTMITTVKEHNASLKDTGKKSRKTNLPILKPECVIMYNENKKGVDFSDQMTAYYSTLTRGLKWFRKLMMSVLFGTCLVNAWLIYKMKTEDQLPLLSFLESIIQSLTKSSFIENTNNQPQKRISHTLEKMEKFRKCFYCYRNLRKEFSSRETDKKVKRVRTFCQECQKAMCLNCYNENHDK